MRNGMGIDFSKLELKTRKLPSPGWNTAVMDVEPVPTEGKPNILKPIQDLIDIVDSAVEYDWMIAGGFPRDWYQEKKFRDVDIYIFDHVTSNWDPVAFRKKLLDSGRFEFFERSVDRFFDGIFYDKTQFDKTPRFQVQFLMWNTTPWEVLKGYDFDLSRFFIPFKKKSIIPTDWGSSAELFDCIFEDRIPYATKEAIKSMDDQKITLTTKTTDMLHRNRKINGYHRAGTKIFELEKLVKRLGKFKSRGMALPDYDLATYLDEFTQSLEGKSFLSSGESFFRSALLEGANEYVGGGRETSQYSPEEIVQNLIEQWILLLPEEEQLRFLTSPFFLTRQVAKKIL